uniref:FBO_C domain-containing protein n=1 Tax=Elaeophora elaphi TaxID=1147741 RepID=A0A0R3RSC6_9BILA
MSLETGTNDVKVLVEETGDDDSDSEVIFLYNSRFEVFVIVCPWAREEWKTELYSRRMESSMGLSEIGSRRDCLLHSYGNRINNDEWFEATKLFLEGVDCERRGYMWEAVRKYMGAVRMVPDIESKLYGNRSPSYSMDSSNLKCSRSKSPCSHHDLEKVLQKRLVEKGQFFEPKFPDEPCPIALLPAELLSILMRYIVGSELDVYCLELLSITSAGFYLFARDTKLWYAICRSTFGAKYVNSISCATLISWRQMYITCPHPYLHGVYIGKITYLRNGEASFQDQFYKPWHIVVYYRMLKFFADGTVIMTITSEAPAQVVGFLKSKSSHLAGARFGHYWMDGQDQVVAQFHRSNEKSVQQKQYMDRVFYPFSIREIVDRKLCMKLRFGDGKRRRAHCVLQIFEYNYTITYSDGKVSHSSLDTTDNEAYPPLFFSRWWLVSGSAGYLISLPSLSHNYIYTVGNKIFNMIARIALRRLLCRFETNASIPDITSAFLSEK